MLGGSGEGCRRHRCSVTKHDRLRKAKYGGDNGCMKQDDKIELPSGDAPHPSIHILSL
jgi:hypothetical protein